MNSPTGPDEPARRETVLAASAVVGGGLVLLLVAGLPPGYPVNDAAAYHRMVELWWQHGQPTFIGWNEMTLLGHLAPAVALQAAGGGSVVARQLMVGLAALVLSALTCRLLIRSGLRPGEAAPAALTWLAGPLTLLSATCFMTEIPQALWCVAWLVAFAAWCRGGGVVAAAGWTSFAIAAFAVRQTGVVLPLAAMAASLVAARKRRGRTIALATLVITVDAALWLVRGSLPFAAVRPLTDLMVPLEPVTLLGAAVHRTAEALASLGLLLVPLAVASMASRARGAVNIGGGLVAAVVGLVLLITGSSFPFWRNTVTVRGLLPDTLPAHTALPPILPSWAWIALTAVGVASLAVLASRALERDRLREPVVAAALAATLSLVAVAAVSRSPIDRYLVPVLPLAVAAVAAAPREPRKRSWPWPALVVLVIVALGSASEVRGLHDRQRAIWAAAEDQVAAGVPAEAVDGGFEWNLWHQPVPFAPEEFRDPSAVLVWYESYPFTRLDPARRLWIGAVPEGWRERSRRMIPGGLELRILVRASPGADVEQREVASGEESACGAR